MGLELTRALFLGGPGRRDEVQEAIAQRASQLVVKGLLRNHPVYRTSYSRAHNFTGVWQTFVSGTEPLSWRWRFGRCRRWGKQVLDAKNAQLAAKDDQLAAKDEQLKTVLSGQGHDYKHASHKI